MVKLMWIFGWGWLIFLFLKSGMLVYGYWVFFYCVMLLVVGMMCCWFNGKFSGILKLLVWNNWLGKLFV